MFTERIEKGTSLFQITKTQGKAISEERGDKELQDLQKKTKWQ